MMESNTLTNTLEKVKSAWNEFDLNKWSNEIGGSPTVAEAIQTGVYFCLSFAIGYFIKKHFKSIIMAIIMVAIIIKGMEYLKLLEIDWTATKNLLGISAENKDFVTPLVQKGVSWIKDNVVTTVACLIGFLLGCKLG